MKTALAIAATALTLASGAAIAHVAGLPADTARPAGIQIADGGQPGQGYGMHRGDGMGSGGMGSKGMAPGKGMHRDDDDDDMEHRMDRRGSMMERGERHGEDHRGDGRHDGERHGERHGERGERHGEDYGMGSAPHGGMGAGMNGMAGPRGEGAFEMLDGNGDGVIDREEFDAHRAQRQPS